MTEKLIPMDKVDRAIRRIEHYGSAEDKEALSRMLNIPSWDRDQYLERPAILAIAERIGRQGKNRRRT